MASCSSPNCSGFIPECGAFDLPYVTDKQYQQNLYDAIDYGDLGQYYDEVTSARGLKLLMYTEYGYRNFAMAKKPVNSVADMEGAKIRTVPGKRWLSSRVQAWCRAPVASIANNGALDPV